MKPFLHDDFLLSSAAAVRLYHEYAAPEPIFDYHCHLPPDQIAANHGFRNLYEIWLGGDHYKWRAMRANGVPEEFCTGSAPDYEKFLAFARSMPRFLRNPLYHWSHLELRRYFDIDLVIDESTAPRIWEECNEKLASPEFRVHAILNRNRVRVVCTTDSPADTLEHHTAIAQNPGTLATRVYPTYRPDLALRVDDPALFARFLQLLSRNSGTNINNFSDFLTALQQRHEFFHRIGGRLSDHGMETVPTGPCSAQEADGMFRRAFDGEAIAPADASRFAFFMMVQFGRWDHAAGWTKQLHLGCLRNINSRGFRTLGPDTGYDTIGDFPHARSLAAYLDALDSTSQLPKTILYNLNPCDNYLFATMITNFMDGTTPGKIQFGSGWWFLDQKDGMTMQLNALSHIGLLSRFVGMLTDSRSFLSYTRHEYFRRILCDMLGRDMEEGELPGDFELVGGMVRDICYRNAEQYFGLDTAGRGPGR